MLGPIRPGVGLDAGPCAGEASHQGARRTFSSVLDAKPVPSTRSVMMSFSRSFTCAASRHHGQAERSHCGKVRRGKVGQGRGRGARRRRVQLAGGSVNGSIMSFLMQSLMHCMDTTMPAGIKRAGSLQWPRKATRRGEPDSGPRCGGGKRAETSPLLCSLRHLRAAAPPPDAHWRVAACSAGTCTCAVRGRSASDRRC